MKNFKPIFLVLKTADSKSCKFYARISVRGTPEKIDVARSKSKHPKTLSLKKKESDNEKGSESIMENAES